MNIRTNTCKPRAFGAIQNWWTKTQTKPVVSESVSSDLLDGENRAGPVEARAVALVQSVDARHVDTEEKPGNTVRMRGI